MDQENCGRGRGKADFLTSLPARTQNGYRSGRCGRLLGVRRCFELSMLPTEPPEPERFRLPQVFNEQRLILKLQLLFFDGLAQLHDDRVGTGAGFVRFF